MDFNSILEILKTVASAYVDKLNLAQLAYALILAVSGLVIVFLARRVTRVVVGRNNIDDNHKYMLGVKFFGIIVFFIGVLIIVVKSII